MSNQSRCPDAAIAENERTPSAETAEPSSGVVVSRPPSLLLEVHAAYNRTGLPIPKPNGPNGRRVLNMEMLMNHAFYWEWLNDRETEEVLMDLYITRTRHSQ